VLKAQEFVTSFLRERGGPSKRAAIIEHVENRGIKGRTTDRALKSLVELGALTKPKQGTYSIRFHTSVLVEEAG
jgi:hypothetical protein